MKSLLTSVCLCFSIAGVAQTSFTMGTVNNLYSQAKDLNVVNGSANPLGAVSTSMSVFGVTTIPGWNSYLTANGPAGVPYGIGFTIDNFANSSNASTFGMQYVGSTDNVGSLYYRVNSNDWQGGTTAYNAWSPWYKIWHSGDDGAGSGLDADLVRGFVPQWTTDSTTGNVFNTNTGKIGIGTAHPQSLLAVNGMVTATGVTVTQTGWSEELTLYAIEADRRVSEQDSLMERQEALLREMQAMLQAQQREIDALKGKAI